jgi:hypothetical protein
MGFAPIGFEIATPYVQNGLQVYYDYGIMESYVGTGTTINDLSGNNKNTTTVNSPTFNSTSGSYFSFNGTNQYLTDITGTTSSFSGNNLTYVGVINYTTTSNYKNILDTFNSINPMMWINTTSKIEIDQAAGYTSTLTYTGQTIQVTFVHSNTSGIGCKLYINGTYIGGNTAAQGAIPSTPRFGLYNRQGSGTYLGKAFNLMIYNKVLSQDEISQNYLAFKNRYGI